MQKLKIKGPYEAFFKRFIDIVASGLVIVLFFWLYVILAIIVRLNLGSPIIFTQDRPGKDGKVFKLYKFRSMSDKRDENGELLPDKLRLNKFGRILRSTSLDELPELFNIIKGDMSLVGPRPLLVKYLEHYNAHDARRHEVRPGLTGLAQVSGRAALSWKEKFEKDIEYVDNLTFLMDVRIVLMTIKKVFVREGIEFKVGNQPIMEYFKECGQEKTI
ncbi:MAG: sugar transferase [Oscillospiraceae bacterium]|nr:sugar transferase [Oscillospiraceae bacterium]